MKRCPTCQRIYTDETLRFCLEDGTALSSTGAASTDQTLLMDSSEAGAEPPPTEILDYSVPPTVLSPDRDATLRRQKPAPTVRQQGRQTVKEFPDEAAPPPAALPRQRSTTSVVAVTVVATILLLGLGGLGAWLILKDKNSSGNGNEPPRAANGSTGTSTNTANASASNSNTTTIAKTTPTATPAQTPTPYASPSATPQTPDAAAMRKEVAQALNGWTETMRAGNLDTHMAYYANTLHTYYLASNISSARVRAIIAPAFSRYTTFDVKLSNVQIEVDPSGTSAVATFDKTFTFSGGSGNYSGSGLNRFWFEKINGRWLVTGEKDLKTYYINK